MSGARAVELYAVSYHPTTMNTKSCNRAIITAAIVGVLLSTYAFYVEMTAEAYPEYEALCDIAQHVSCSRVLTSEYSKGFGITSNGSSFEVPNCIYGIIFYCIMIFFTTFDHLFVVRLQLLLSLTSLASCVYLAYILIFVLYDFCIVCVSTYFVNGSLAALVYKKTKSLTVKNK